jgi:prepilin-type N-terminal cleavage/methylation domain-containing protein
MNIKIANNKGFTFIEIIIVIIVLGILSVFGFHFISTGIHTYSMMEKQKGLFDQATMVMERISRELRDANTITTPEYGDSGSTLEFEKSHGTREETTTYAITFQCPDTTLQRIGSTTPATVTLADNVNTFNVERGTVADGDEDRITITLTLESGEANITLQSCIYPKNLDYPPEPNDFSGRNFGGDWEEHCQGL